MAPRKKRTTSATRSKRQRTSTARVTRSGQGGGRGRVTNAAQRTTTGRARVTGKPQLALPPGKKGGSLVKPKSQTSRQAAARVKAAKAAKGTKGGTRVGQPAGSANRMYGANVVNKAVKRATRSARLAKGAKVLKGAGRFAVGAYLADKGAKLLGRAADQKEWNRLSKELKARRNKNKPTVKGAGGGQGNRNRNGSTPAKRPVANLPKDYKKTEAAAFKAAKKPKPSGGSSTTTSRRAAAPAAPRKAAAPKAKKLTDKQRMVGASSSDRMAAWAKANRKMIEKSGTKAQKAILAKALKPKTATGGKTTIIPNKTKVAFSKGTNLRSDKKKKK